MHAKVDVYRRIVVRRNRVATQVHTLATRTRKVRNGAVADLV
jgi:hypothetical protein